MDDELTRRVVDQLISRNCAAANKTALAKKIDDFALYLKEFFNEMDSLRGEFITTPDRAKNNRIMIKGLEQRKNLI